MILDFFKNTAKPFALCARSLVVYVSGQTHSGKTVKLFRKDKYVWLNEDIYMFEKYDVKLNDDFVAYVLENMQ